jgi:hypothetical protein
MEDMLLEYLATDLSGWIQCPPPAVFLMTSSLLLCLSVVMPEPKLRYLSRILAIIPLSS